VADGKADEPGGGDQQRLGARRPSLTRATSVAAAIKMVGRSMMERRPSTITAPAMAPMAPAVTPSTNAATAGCLPWRRNHGAGMMVSR
jgi:hypothetical protein